MSNFDAKWNKSVLRFSDDIEFAIYKNGEKKLIGEILFDFNDYKNF